MTGCVVIATGTFMAPAIPFTVVEGAVVSMAAINALAFGAFMA